MDNPAMEMNEGIKISDPKDNPDTTSRRNGNCEASVAGNGDPYMPHHEPIDNPTKSPKLLHYEINDKPPWYLTLFLGFQHYLTMAGSTVSVPFLLTPLMCMADNDPDKANIISTIIFVSGIVTLLQSTFGTRLPIIQGGSFSFLVPSLAILALPQFKCPETLEGLSDIERRELWQIRIREIQGAIIVSAFFEVFLGISGAIGLILPYITPMTVAPAIALIGMSLFKVSAIHAASNWPIALGTIGLIILFSQYLRSAEIPIPFTRSEKGNGCVRYPIFAVFPVLLTMGLMWLLCYLLTLTDALALDNPARTDIKENIIRDSLWFRFPYPLQWGLPTVTAGAVFGMLSGVIAGTVESIGDYYAAARISGAGPPPIHAINRGILMEGLGCVLAGIWGTGNGTTSYSENIGAISVTKVGSRRVIQAAGFLMIVCALIGKVGALFISIPEPIIGGVFCVVFATVTAVGLSNLQGVDLNSPRNIFVIGFSLFFGLTISQWMEANQTAIRTGNESVDQVIIILLRTAMFVGGLIGFILDNTIPGTDEERGLTTWNAHHNSTDGDLAKDQRNPSGRDRSYDLPIGMGLIQRVKCFRRFPISPTFTGILSSSNIKLPTIRKRQNGGESSTSL